MDWKAFFTKHTLGCLAGGFAIGLVVCAIGAGMMSFSGSAAFCGSCHAMKGEAASFAKSTHSKQDCVECHLPHDNMAIYMIEKGRTGMVDTYHAVLRDYPARIDLSAGGEKTVNGNCLRCHEKTMSGVHMAVGVDKDTGADCLKCHSRIAHGSNHLEGGIKVE